MIGLVQYEWNIDDGFPHWKLPGGLISAIDMRTLPQQAKVGPQQEGYGFAIYPGQLPHNSIPIDDNLVAEALGFGRTDLDSAQTPDEKVWRILTQLADPTGLNAVKPLVPTSRRIMEFRLTGMDRNERFDPILYPRVFELVRHDYYTLKSSDILNRSDHYKRVLDAYCHKYHTNPEGLGLAGEERLQHQTIITESFNTADSDTLGPDLTWTELNGDNFDIVSNRAEIPTTSNATNRRTARADSDLSSDDHYGQCIAAVLLGDTLDPDQAGGCARFNSSAVTYYVFFIDARSDEDEHDLFKVVTTTFTRIGSGSVVFTNSPPHTVRTTANGSIITGDLDGTEVQNGTDTAITGNLRCGIYGIAVGAAGNVALDSFEAADLAALVGLERHYPRGAMRGVLRGAIR